MLCWILNKEKIYGDPQTLAYTCKDTSLQLPDKTLYNLLYNETKKNQFKEESVK